MNAYRAYGIFTSSSWVLSAKTHLGKRCVYNLLSVFYATLSG